tara:strand:+ start:986 stop:1240 length:255 start_codon:yes stop_codon:yes gene_type:complete
MANIEERVTEIIVDKLAVDESQVSPGANYAEDLDADSLDLAELVMALEEEFSSDSNKLEISDDDAAKIKTVGDTIAFLESKGIK